MNSIVTITLEHEPDGPHGKRHSVQTQFCYSQRHSPEARAAIESLHARLVASIPPAPRHVYCTDGSVRVRRR